MAPNRLTADWIAVDPGETRREDMSGSVCHEEKFGPCSGSGHACVKSDGDSRRCDAQRERACSSYGSEAKQIQESKRKILAIEGFENRRYNEYNLTEQSSMGLVAKALGDRDAKITTRMRALFLARNIGGQEAVDALLNGLEDPSVLLKHEIAYVLGQLGHKSAAETLTILLSDTSQNDMVRHEAAESLAAIGCLESQQLLEKFARDTSAPVAETCRLALVTLEEVKKLQGDEEEFSNECRKSKYRTVDPICAQKYDEKDVKSLTNAMLNPDNSLARKYEALFALRDLGTPAACQAISDALVMDKTSALFRHEIAFVIGQLQYIHSIDALTQCLCNEDEHCMGRHEAALALGAVVCGNIDRGDMSEAVQNLIKYADHPEQVVRESCIVAFDNVREELNQTYR